MKKFLLIAALALMAVIWTVPSYGQTSVPEAPDIGVEILCTPAVQMEYVLAPACGTLSQDILGTTGTVLYTLGPVVRMPMLKPEDAPMPLPLFGIRLWRPPVNNESVWNPQFTAATSTARPHNIRNAVFLSESRQATDNPALNL